MQATRGEASYQELYSAPNQSTKVLLYHTNDGSCVLKRWLSERVRIGGNRSQPLAEYAALLDLQDVPNINTPIKITLESSGIDFIYAYCGADALQWRAKLQQEQDDDEHREQQAEQLANHVAVHVLLALQEMSERGIVHRDVKPSNILLQDFCGFTWLSDMGLATRAQHLPGFVKGLDLSYIPPEYIVQSSDSNLHSINDVLPALAKLTTTAADVYQLGLTVYQLLHGSLPSHLTPKKGARSNPDQLSELLFRVATFNWKREIARNIASADAAELLEALLQKDPALRPTPEEALKFAWLQPVLQPALQLLEQQRQQWPAMQQQALRAAKHMELQQIQEDLAALRATAAAEAAAAAGVPGSADGGAGSSSSKTAAEPVPLASDTFGWGSGRMISPVASGAGAAAATETGSSAHRSYASAVTAAAAAAAAPASKLVVVVDITPAAAAETWGPEGGSGDVHREVWGDSSSSSSSSRTETAWGGGSSSAVTAAQTAEHAEASSTTAAAVSVSWRIEGEPGEWQQQQRGTGVGTLSSAAPGGEGHGGW